MKLIIIAKQRRDDLTKAFNDLNLDPDNIFSLEYFRETKLQFQSFVIVLRRR